MDHMCANREVIGTHGRAIDHIRPLTPETGLQVVTNVNQTHFRIHWQVVK